jgi:anaerobic magnesium-protoporphyrin IX monomethyl ester cyclase
MRIQLVRPEAGVIPNFLPPLGLLSICGYLRKYGSDFQLKVTDCRLQPNALGLAEKEIRDFKPDIIGITGLTVEKHGIHEFAQLFKRTFPQVPVVAGGPYATASNVELLNDPHFDFVVMGAGEEIFLQLLNRFIDLGTRAEYEDINSLCYRGMDGQIRLNSRRTFIEDLDTIPMVAWDLIDLEPYFASNRSSMNLHRRSRRILPIMSTRGCPYHCTYCHDLFGKKLRKRSVDHVLGEIKHVASKYGVREIEFIDDVFNLDKVRAKAIFDGVIQAGLKLGFSFPNGLRADVMDEELVDKMKEAGVYRLIYAVESGSPRIQKLIKKNLDLDKTMHMINYTAGKNISTGGFFIMGLLDETEEEVRMTIDFACKSHLHTAAFFILQPFPNTEIFQQALDQGIIMPLDAMDEGGHYNTITHNISRVPTRRLERLKDHAARRFWFNPWRVYRFFRATPIRQNFFRKFWNALRIIMLGNIEKKKPVW